MAITTSSAPLTSSSSHVVHDTEQMVHVSLDMPAANQKCRDQLSVSIFSCHALNAESLTVGQKGTTKVAVTDGSIENQVVSKYAP